MDTNIDDIAGANVGPIKRLPPEILELIFRENTDLFSTHSHNRLNTARSSSQVCQEWRATILSSPTLWGRLIDLDQLNFAKVEDQWRNEVLSRSESALLWIQGNVYPTDYENVISFLDQNWTRIQRVDISEGDRTISQSTPEISSWVGLERSAPYLQSFVVAYIGYPKHHSQSLESNIFRLFAGGAPVLEELSVPRIKFDINSSWLSNIRSITFSTTFSVPQIFQILKATPILENLYIYTRLGRSSEISPSYEIYANFPTINLPRLGRLILRTHFATALPFLGRLNVATCCIPFITMDADTSWSLESWGGIGSVALARKHEALEIIQGRVSTLLREYFKAHRVTQLSIVYREDRFDISGHSDMDLSATFSIGGPFPNVRIILEDISLCKNISSVEEMTIYIGARQPASHYLLQIPSNLQSLTKIETDEDTLKFLIANKEPDTLPFPSLNVIKLTRLNPSFAGSRYPSITIWDFFNGKLVVIRRSRCSILRVCHIMKSMTWSILTWFLASR